MLRNLFCKTCIIIGLVFFAFGNQLVAGNLFKRGNSVEEMMESLKDGKPLLVLCTLYEVEEYSKMEADILTDKSAISYIGQHFHSYKFDAIEQIEITQYWDVVKFPTFLVIGKDGKVLERLEGVVDTRQLVGELNGIEENGEKRNPNVRGLAYGMRSTADIFYLDAAKYAYYSLKKASLNGYGLRLGLYTSLTAMEQELKKIERAWKREIIVYVQTDKRKTVYGIILGDFKNYEEAKDMQEILYQTHLLVAPILPFNTLHKSFIETE